MRAFDPALLAPDQCTTLAGSPTQALLDLARLVRDLVPAVIVGVDLLADRGIDDPRAAFDRTLGPQDERRTRVVGPASGGVAHGAGGVALLSMIGPLAPRIAQAVGPELGLAVDLGLGWDLDAAEIALGMLASPGIHTLGLALPPTHYRSLAPALRIAQGRVAVFALAADAPTGALAQALGRYGVGCVSDLGALARALATPIADRPRGPRIGVVSGTGPLASFVAPAFQAAGLTLAGLSRATLDHLAGELPITTRTEPFLQIPGASERHATLAVESLRADLGVDHVLAFDLPGFGARDPALEARHLAALAWATSAAAAPHSELPDEAAASPRAEALLAAAVLMRRDTLERETTCAILSALVPELQAAPASPVASLAAAHHLAARIGYPVLLGAAGAPVPDAHALTARWEAIVAGLVPSEAPVDRRAPDPFAAHVIQQAPATLQTLRYVASPLPSVDIDQQQTLALPLRFAELRQLEALAPALMALSLLSTRLPEVAALQLGVARVGERLLIVHAAATLQAADVT